MRKSQLILRVLLVAFWVRMTVGYVAQMIVPQLDETLPYVALGFDAVIVALGFATIRRKRDLAIAAVFITVSAVSSLMVNRLDLLFYLNGLRDFVGFLFVFPILNYFFADDNLRDHFVKTVDRHLMAFLVLQAPCILTQFIRYGAADPVGGSLGTMNSGLISTLIYLISFYLMQRRLDREHVLASLWKNKWLLVLLLPTFLNETKVSIVYMLMYLILLIPIDRKAFSRTLIAIPAIALAVYGAATAYVVATGGSEGDVFSLDYYMEGYLLNSDTDDAERFARWLIEDDVDAAAEGLTGDVPRFTKMLILPDIMEDGTHWTIGHGVGHFKGGTITANSAFFNENEWTLTGTIPYSFHMLVQLGVVGLVLLVAFFVIHLGFPPRKGMKRLHNLQLYVIGLLLILQLYQDTLRNAHLCLVLFYIIMMSWHWPATVTDEGDADS